MKQSLLPPKIRKNVKCYLDCKICVTQIVHEKKWSMVFLRGVIQLAFLVSSYNRSNIDGHTIRLHQTYYFAAPFVWHLWNFDRVIFHGQFGIGSLNLMCRLLSSVVGKTNTSFSFHSLQIISYFHRWKRHIKQLYFKTLQHENPDEFSLKVILISWKFNVTGRLSLPKINLWLWIHERKENVKKIWRIIS